MREKWIPITKIVKHLRRPEPIISTKPLKTHLVTLLIV